MSTASPIDLKKKLVCEYFVHVCEGAVCVRSDKTRVRCFIECRSQRQQEQNGESSRVVLVMASSGRRIGTGVSWAEAPLPAPYTALLRTTAIEFVSYISRSSVVPTNPPDLVFSIETLAAGAEFEPCAQSLSVFQTNYEAASCNATYNTSSDALLTPAVVAHDILPHVFPNSLSYKDLKLAFITITPTLGALVVTASDGGRFHLLRHGAPFVDWRTLHAIIARYHHRTLPRTLERLEQDFSHVPKTYVTLVLSLCRACPSRQRRRDEENDLPLPFPSGSRSYIFLSLGDAQDRFLALLFYHGVSGTTPSAALNGQLLA
ncbi:hypothetical protein BDZ89DRAFT_1037866 [Hymenopellis radicata]|nr:hypothetical protein BDZ89DRAFT_1037866 [Hymenopellis radicata]